jgi:AcrR family transcriptional regulator
MSPAGIYRYFDGLDELLTSLITDAYSDLADAVEQSAAGEGGATARLRRAMLAYRQWSVHDPNRFLLIFGTPIPGYAAPEEGPTVHANRRLGAVFFGLLVQGWQAGELDLPVSPRPATEEESRFLEGAPPGFPAAWLPPFIGAWAHFHGMVTLELLHQLDWIYPDARQFYTEEIDRLLASWRRPADQVPDRAGGN